MSNGDGGGFDFGGFFDGLLGVLAAIIDAIIQFLIALVNVLVQILNFLYQGELGIFGFTKAAHDSVWRAFKNLLDDALHLRIIKSLKDLRDLYERLRKWIQKLKAFLDRLRKIQQLYQVQALKRFINLIQRIRQVLVVFRLLHLKFASKLDNWLAGIEGKLITRTAQIQAKTNEIIAWINLIADPKLGLTHLPVFIAATRSLDTILSIFTGHGIDMWLSKSRRGGPGLLPPITYTQHYDALRADLRSGGGDVAAWRLNFAESLAALRVIK